MYINTCHLFANLCTVYIQTLNFCSNDGCGSLFKLLCLKTILYVVAFPEVLHKKLIDWYPSRLSCVVVRTPLKHAPFGSGFSNVNMIADCLTRVLYKSNVAFDLPSDLRVSDCSDQLCKFVAFWKSNNNRLDLKKIYTYINFYMIINFANS